MTLDEIFPATEPELVEVGSELQERVAFPIRSEDGAVFIIDYRYREAIRFGLDALTDETGQPALRLYADDKGSPRLIPVATEERRNGPSFTFPIGRIIHDAGPCEQVERRSKAGDKAREWTVANTRKSGGKAHNEATRREFLTYIRDKVGASAADETERLLLMADAITRRDPESAFIEVSR